MKLFYLANNRLPTEKAHGVQIAKMCSAFISAKVDLLLVLPRRQQPSWLKNIPIHEYYSLPVLIPTRKLFCIDFLLLKSRFRMPDFFGVLAYWIQSFTFALSAWFFCFFRKGVFYSRDLFLLLPLVVLHRPCYFEGHSFPQTKIGRFLYTFVLSRTRGVIVITHQLKSLYKESFHLKDESILVAHDGVDINQFLVSDKTNARRTLHFPLDHAIIMYTGNLYPWKGVYTLIESSQHLSCSPYTLYIVGGDKHDRDFMKLKNFVTRHGFKNIVLTGYIPYRDIPLYLNAADVLVIPNSKKDVMSATYTSPLKLFEYMASKKPIVASRIPSLCEVLNDNNAFFFEPDDAASLAAVLDKVFANFQSALELGKKAHHDVEQYTWEKRASHILGFLSNFL